MDARLMFASVGVVALLATLTRLIHGLWVVFLRPGSKISAKYGKWAIVTGATDGIGKAFSIRLAKSGVNVILMSRGEEKLREVAKELESKYKVETKILALDFADVATSLPSALSQLSKILEEVQVGVLINNVGMSYPYAMFFHELSDELIQNLISVNIISTTRLTKLVIQHMLKHKRGAVVFIGSGAASVIPSDPLYSVYAGTKGYVDHFARSLYVEYKVKGIDVQCQVPLYVATKLAKIRRASLACPSPDTYAKAALQWVGGDVRCTPYWVHSLMWALIASLPEQLFDSVRLRQNLDIRKRGLAKERKQKEQKEQ
eukprot:TRINITY_DN3266_c0_g1_i1.p1 TRINITY_DN3266_c0_g1~~TRINITY_DN3266_c0_g1_i1.p1  ORF type:complete len:316 (-),score=48.17 TRINITY_DN3266_c0_g1_i1:363-1310(-)